MLADLHVHTEYSHDSWATIDDILDTAERRAIEAIAITDHDTVTGARKACRLANGRDITVLPGVERTVPAGEHGIHLIGLNVEKVPPNDDVISVVESIHDQGGTVVVPHPFRAGTGLLFHAENGTLPWSAVEFVLEQASLMEILNWKDSQSAISRTLEFVRDSGHGIVAGTDAHTSADIGRLLSRIDSPDAVEHGSAVVVPVNDPATVRVDNLPDRLSSRSPRLRDSQVSVQLVSNVAELMDIIPGNEPNRTAKRITQYIRTVLEETSADKSVNDDWSSSILISRSNNGTNLRLEPTDIK